MTAPPPPKPKLWQSDRYYWHYHKIGRFRWHGDYGQYMLGHEWGWSAWSERGIRRKLARLIRKERIRDQRKQITERSSSR